MFLSFVSENATMSDDSWGPFSISKEVNPLNFSTFTKELRSRLGSLEIDPQELDHYYQRHVEEGFSVNQISDLIARDKTFFPLTHSYAYSPVRVADLGTSLQEQEFQLAFKQKAKSGFKGINYIKKAAIKRQAILKRQNQKTLTKEQEKERKMQMDKMSKMKGQKYRERKRWNDKPNFFSKPLASSVEIRSSWESKSVFSFAKLQKEEYKNKINSEILLEAGYVYFYNNELDQITTKKAKKLITPKEPKFTYYSVKTMEDKHLQKFAEESKAQTTVVITDRILSLIMASTRSVYSWDIVVIKKDGKIYFDKRNHKQRVDILSVDETSRTPPEISEDPNDINSEYNLSMEATRVNLQFQRFAVKEPKNNNDPTILNLDPSEPHPFQKDDQVPAPVGYIYKRFMLNDFDIICRCEVDGAIGTPENPKFITIRALNEWKPKSREDWRSQLDGSQGSVLVTEIKNNACKFARWVSQATLSGTEDIKIGFVSRVDSNKKSPHAVLGVGSYLNSLLTQQIGLTKRNMWGVLNAIVSELSKVEDGKYTLVKLPNKQAIQLYRISTSVTGSLILRKNESGNYQYLLLKTGDATSVPITKTEHGEESIKTVRRYLKRDLGITEQDILYSSNYKFVSQFEDPESYEERSEVIFAALLKDASFELNLSENYGDYEWRDLDQVHEIDQTSQNILKDFKKFAESKGGLDKCF